MGVLGVYYVFGLSVQGVHIPEGFVMSAIFSYLVLKGMISQYSNDVI